jgi:hypothetical protein
MHLVVSPLGLGLDLVLTEGEGQATEVARGLYVVQSDDGTLLRVYLAGLDLYRTGLQLVGQHRSGARLPRVEVDRLLRRVRLVVSDESPSTCNEVLPGVEVAIDSEQGPMSISFLDASVAA